MASWNREWYELWFCGAPAWVTLMQWELWFYTQKASQLTEWMCECLWLAQCRFLLLMKWWARRPDHSLVGEQFGLSELQRFTKNHWQFVLRIPWRGPFTSYERRMIACSLPREDRRRKLKMTHCESDKLMDALALDLVYTFFCGADMLARTLNWRIRLVVSMRFAFHHDSWCISCNASAQSTHWILRANL